MKPLLIMNYRAEGALAAHRIAAAGSEDQAVKQAAASTEALLGVTTDVGGVDGKRVDVIHTGIAPVEFGGSVDYGALLTANADGKAVTAAAGDRVLGTAMCGGINGDIGLLLLGAGAKQTA